jgi:hypothetical protein
VIARFGVLLLAAAAAFCEPRLLLDPAGFDRAEVLRRVADWPAAHVREFGLREWALPAEGAGWSHAYVCPVHGVRLSQKAGRNLCPIDGKDYHGWPVDNVVYMQRNDDNARAAPRIQGVRETAGKLIVMTGKESADEIEVKKGTGEITVRRARAVVVISLPKKG